MINDIIIDSEAVPLGIFCTVFQAELHAINLVCSYCLKNNLVNKSIFICSDSKAALAAVMKYNIRSKCVYSTVSSLNQISNISLTNSLDLVWIPGHSGIKGNDLADSLARAGASITFNGPEPVLPVSVAFIYREIKSWALDSHL